MTEQPTPDLSCTAQLHLMPHQVSDVRSHAHPDGYIVLNVEAGNAPSFPGFEATLTISGTPEQVLGLLDQLRAAAEAAATQLPARGETT